MTNEILNYDKIIEETSSANEYFGNKYPQIMKNLDKNHKFNDPNFKPSKDIINIEEVEDKIDSKILKWKRISDIIDIENDKSDKYFVNQNFLGDCYLIAFLRSLQYFQPQRYYFIFGTCFPEIGYYEIYFFTDDGSHIKVFVDDYVLVDENYCPYFSSLKKEEEELYTIGRNILIEKAFAKMNKSYKNIEGGLNASFYIVGINSGTEDGFLSKENNYIYQTFEKEIDLKNIVLCGTINEGENLDLIKGLQEGHMYSLLSTEEKSDLKILKLNNPYGINYPDEMEDFKLGLGRKYEDVEKEIIRYNKNNTNNGNLKIDIQNFKKQFDLVEICSFTDTKKQRKIKGISPLPPDKINESYDKRKNTLDALGISKEDQRKFIEKCNGNVGKALYLIFKAFMKYGTSKQTFYIRLLDNQNYGQNNSQNQSSFSFLSYLNPFSYFNTNK